MTIEDAITHHAWAAIASSGKVAEEHRQQAEWLQELKFLKEEHDEICVNEWLAIIGRDTFKKANDRLERENAKLRELVRDLVALPAVPAFDCFGCRYEKHTDCGGGCTLVRRAKELGIEVDE